MKVLLAFFEQEELLNNGGALFKVLEKLRIMPL